LNVESVEVNPTNMHSPQKRSLSAKLCAAVNCDLVIIYVLAGLVL